MTRKELIDIAFECGNNKGVCERKDCPFYKEIRCFDRLIIALADELDTASKEIIIGAGQNYEVVYE